MTGMTIRELSADEIRGIYPFAKLLNPTMEQARFNVLIEQMLGDGYRCAGVLDGERLIGVCGLWIRSQFFSGRTVELDNLVLLDDYKNQGHGRALMRWVEDLGRTEGCEKGWLKTYVGNTPSHRFYYNQGYDIVGFGFLKDLEQ